MTGTTQDAARLPRLRFLDTVLYGIVMMVGLRWLPVAAAVGPAAIPMWVLAFFVFYIPLSVAAAELTSQFPGEGGLYTWVRETYGPLAGFLCSWFYWISLLPYFAGILYFLSGLFLSAIGADMHDKTLYLLVSLGIACFVTAFQFLGLRGSKWLTNFGATGNWLIFFGIVAVAIVFFAGGESASHFGSANYLPPADFNTAILWGTIIFAICGAETLAFLQDEIAGGVRTIVRVLGIVGVGTALIYIAGTVAMLVILPQADLTRLAGLPDVLHAAFAHAGAPGLAAVAIGFFALAQMGGFTAWFGVGTRVTVAVSADRFLPSMFARRHPKTGAPGPAIMLMGVLTLLMVVLSQAGAGAAAAYDFLVSMSVLTVTIPYVFVFAAYLKRVRAEPVPGAWVPPGGVRLRLLIGVVGQAATLVAIACTMVPNGSDAHPLETFLKIVLSTLAAAAVGLIFYTLGNRRRVAVAAAE